MPDTLVKSKTGFSLMEVMVSLFIIMVIMLGIYSLILLSLSLNEDNTYYVEAVEIANQKMEQIRNMPYADVGVTGGIPNGSLPQKEYIYRTNTYKVETFVTYFDDQADGHAASSSPDSIPNDYKIASVKVTWATKAGDKDITFFSKIIPRTVETSEGYGLLKISVNDANAQALKNARIRIVNNLTSPVIDVVGFTDNKGILYQPATSSYQGYEIYVSKTDEEPIFYYGHDQTYGTSTSKSPFHMTVTEGNMTAEAFTIDKLAKLHIETVGANLPDNWQVNGISPFRQELLPRISLDAADNMYFTWQSWTGTSSYIYAQKYDTLETKQWASDILISSTEHQQNPDIATAQNGISYIVWQDNSSTLKAITRGPEATRLALNRTIPSKRLPDWVNSYFTPANTFSSPKLIWSDKNDGQYSFATEYRKKSLSWDKSIYSFNYDALQKSLNLLRDSFKIPAAKALGNIIQTKKSSNVGSGNYLIATLDSQPTPGNTLIAIGVHRNAYNSFGTPYNSSGDFTESVYSNISWYLDVGIWHKVVGAGEDQTVVLPCNGSINGGVLMLMEVAGLDTSDLVNVTAENSQVSNDSFTATTGLTPVSADSGFAVAAIAFADNDFFTPGSGNWYSGSSDTWSHRMWDDWSNHNDGSLAVATMDVTNAAQQSATLILSGSDDEQRNSVMVVYNLYDPDDVNLTATGTQIATTTPGASNEYVGGTFVISDTTGSRNITDITISENGTIDAHNDLDNIRLYYDLDTSPPYDCGLESYSGAEAQFGSTDTSGFSASNGTSTFSDVLPISTTQTACIYVVMDILSSAEKYENIDIQISDPVSDIVLDSGTLMTGSAVSLDGTTEISKPPELHQSYYRWRYDNDNEVWASWKELEDTGTTITGDSTIRLRFKIVNDGSESSNPTAYRIEYGEKISSCNAASWNQLPNNDTMHWRTASSTYYSDGASTTEQLSIPAGVGYKPGQIKTQSNLTDSYILNGDSSTEIEFAINATSNASDNPYCFRVTNNGVALDAYDIYPEITVVGDDNIYIISLDSAGNTLWATKRVNQDSSNAMQTLPRIALTEESGTATSVVVWQDDRNGNQDIFAQSFDQSGNKLWSSGNDKQITSSSTDETEAVVAIYATNTVYIAWTDETAASDRIYMQKFSLDGSAQWAQAKRMVNSSYDISQPNIDFDGSGNIILAYTETIIGIDSANIARYSPDGTLDWDKRANQEAATSNQNSPDCAADNSYVYVTWTDDRDNNPEIYAQKFDLSGSAQWSEDQRISITTGSSSQENTSLVVNSLGDAYSVWQDARDSNYEIYATYFEDPNALAPISNVPITIRGTKTISETPLIYEYDKVFNSNGSGELDLMLEYDTFGYYIDVVATATALQVEMRDPVQPLSIMPDEDLNWYIYLK